MGTYASAAFAAPTLCFWCYVACVRVWNAIPEPDLDKEQMCYIPVSDIYGWYDPVGLGFNQVHLAVGPYGNVDRVEPAAGLVSPRDAETEGGVPVTYVAM